MNSRHRLYAAALAALTLSASAQAPLTAPGAQGFYARAGAFYNADDWEACLDQIELIDSKSLSPVQREQLAWQHAMASFKLQRPDAQQLFERFIADFPASAHRQDARMGIADCLFTKNYADALAAYAKVDPAGLSPRVYDDYIYRTAYCYLKLGDYDHALTRFESLYGSDEYANAAKFYCGYIAYARGEYAKAREIFSGVNTATAPGDMTDYYLCQIYFAEQDYTKAIQTAQAVLARPGASADFTAEANRIAGESLYLTGRADSAIPYLRRYVQAVESPLPSSLYILGLSEYAAADYSAAVKTLAPVADEDSSMGQNANLYIGQALLRLGDSDGAIMSFDRALNMRHDDAARENAYYNYIVARYQGGNVPFGSSVTVFEEYLTQYPDSPHSDAVREYVIEGWLTDNNYEAALKAIENVRNPSERVLSAKQRVLYALGLRDLAGGRTGQAVSRLEAADALRGHNAEIARETDLALGEAYLRRGSNEAAVNRLIKYLDEVPDNSSNRSVALYDLGYARLAQKDYNKAAINFRRLTERPKTVSSEVLADAYNRLGDANLCQKNWTEATAAYTRAAELMPSAADYPLFQLAVIDGYTGRSQDKVKRLEELQRRFPNSGMMPDVLLEKAEAQTHLGELDSAKESLTNLTEDFGQTTQSRQARLRLANTLDQQGKREQADKTYRQIITEYPTSDEALQALDALKMHAADNGTMAELQSFLATVENAPVIDTGDADRLSFQAAEQAYTQKEDASLLRAYIKQYPNGSGALKALGYLLEDADARKNDDEAYNYACRIVEQFPDNAAAEDALLLKADIEYDRGQGQLALKTWQQLAARASNPDNATFARMGIMRVARDTGDADLIIESADAILSSSSTGAEDRTEATFSRGLALQLKGQRAEARKLWESVASQTEDLYGAQAAVYLAQSLLDDKQLKQARKVATDFVGKATSHTYWLGRGFIVLSDIARAEGNDYEADSFLQALKKNYPGTDDDIPAMIDERLKK